MNHDNIIQDGIITRLIAEIRTQDPSPEEVRSAMDRLKRRLGSRLAPGQSQAQPSPGIRGSAEPARWRRPMLRLGIAAAVVGSVTLWQWMPTRQNGTGVAFGQVLDAVRRATSMTYTMIDHAPEGDENIVQTQVHAARWIRLVGGGRGIRIIDLQQSQMLRFDDPDGPGKSAELYSFVGDAAAMLQSAAGPLTEFNDLLPGDGQPLGNKMIDGQPVIGFRVMRPSLSSDLEDRTVWDIWADAETAQVVRVDVRYERDLATLTLVDFHFDVDIEDSLFRLQPPPGYTVHYETIETIESGD